MDEAIIVGTAPSAEQLERLSAAAARRTGLRMLDVKLPPLPDLDELLDTARKAREHFVWIAEQAQAEADRADVYIARLSGQLAAPGVEKRRQSPKRCSPETYRAVLTKLAEHKYAGVATLTGAGVSTTTAAMAARSAVGAGHATVERRGKKNRFTITDAGMEFLTGP